MTVAFSGFLACLLFVEPRQEVKLVFAPRAGSSVAKQADFSIAFRSITTEVDGNSRDDISLSPLRLHTSVSFTDTYAKLAEGRPQDFLRNFTKLIGTLEAPKMPMEIGGFDALSGSAVRFVWSERAQSFERRLERGKARGLRLEELVEDMDLRAFLPAKALKVGSEWTARGRGVMDALFGAIESGLAAVPAEHEKEAEMHKFFLRPFRGLGNEQVEFSCTLAEADSSAPALARIELKQKDSFELDIADAANEYMGSTTDSQLYIERLALEWKVDGKGLLSWNTAENRFEAFDFEAEVEIDVLIEVPYSGPGGIAGSWKVRIHMEGIANWSTKVLP